MSSNGKSNLLFLFFGLFFVFFAFCSLIQLLITGYAIYRLEFNKSEIVVYTNSDQTPTPTHTPTHTPTRLIPVVVSEIQINTPTATASTGLRGEFPPPITSLPTESPTPTSIQPTTSNKTPTPDKPGSLVYYPEQGEKAIANNNTTHTNTNNTVTTGKIAATSDYDSVWLEVISLWEAMGINTQIQGGLKLLVVVVIVLFIFSKWGQS